MNTANSSQTKRNLSINSKYNHAFRDEAKRLKLSQGELFDKLWEKYQDPGQSGDGGLGLNSEESDLIQKAIEASGMKFCELLKQGLLKEAESLVAPEIEAKPAPQELTAAEKRVWEKVNQLMFWNSYCNPEHRAYISPSLVRRCHAAAYSQITKVLAMREQDIAVHHEQFGISEDANRKGRDAQGRQIKVEELIGSYPPPAPKDSVVQVVSPVVQFVVDEHTPEESTEQGLGSLSPKDYFQLLKDEINPSAHERASRKLLEELRSRLDVRISTNTKGQLKSEGEGSPADLDKELEKYRRLFRNHPLTPATISYRQLKNARLPSSYPGGKAPEGSRLNDDGLVIAEPRHLAISYLVLSDIENAYMNLSRGEQYAEQYPQYSLV